MLENLKTLLGIAEDDTDRDKLLNLILNAVKSRLKILLGGIDPPADMEYIIIDVAAIRFNRIGSEGLSSHTVEGESLSFSANDFAGYADDIQAYLDVQKDAKKGKVTFL